MFVKVDLAQLTESKKEHQLEIAGFCTQYPKTFVWALKAMLKSAQAVWPEELREVMIVNRFTHEEASGEAEK